MAAWITFLIYNAFVTLLFKFGLQFAFNQRINYLGLYLLSIGITMVIAVTMYGAKKKPQ